MHLESLSFDEEDLFDSDYYDGGYYDEWADAEQGAQRIIREALAPYERKIRQRWQQGDLAGGTAVLLGLYEGKSSATTPAHDSLDILQDGYAETVGEVLREVFAELFTALEQIVKSPTEAQTAIDLLLERYRRYDVSVRELRNRQTYVFYQLQDFQALFVTLASEPDTARWLLDRLQTHDLVDTDTAHVVLHVARQLNDDALWLRSAEEFAPYDVGIARLLLGKYQEAERPEDFLRVAQQTFAQFPDQIDEYLVHDLSIDAPLNFYKEVHMHVIRRLHRFDYYQVIRTYLSESEKDRLIEDVRLTYHDEFYVQLLAAEERYADILERVRARTHANQFLDQLMEPILTVYPDECFRILRRKCEETVLERGRAAYRLIARWLQLMKGIEGYQSQTAQLASQLYHRKPNLPALKDEMRRAGVAPA